MEEYMWVERGVELINFLSIKWRIIDPKNFAYRIERRRFQDDLEKLQYLCQMGNFFSMDAFWLANSAR
jgi:hypothetical protein